MPDTASYPVGVIGSGLVASRVSLHLASAGLRPRSVSRERVSELFGSRIAVLAHAGPHAALAGTLASEGVAVVSVSDDLSDVLALLDTGDRANTAGVPIVVGAAASPGLTGLLLDFARGSFDSIDEVHTAVHGTGGPACARQHHSALAGVSVGWHDGEWLQRPAGSGRELCWFPDPVGPRDCYRFASPDPVVMQKARPELQRITARVSATRRDRLTARLPMLAPPHAEGGVGGLRTEVRGVRDGRRHVEIFGVAERLATIAGSVAAQVALAIERGEVAPGVHVLGQDTMPNKAIRDGVLATGTVVHQFVGR